MNSKLPRADYVQTYFALRLALGVLALLLPLALFAFGASLQGIALQPSISAYYHSDARDVFVGVLCAIGFGLIAYKGFGRAEDWALNLGGVLACSIALFPMDPAEALLCIQPECVGACLAQSAQLDRTSSLALASQLHFPAAISFFVVLGYVMIFCSHRTLHLVPVQQRRWYLSAYPLLGALFVGSMVWAFVLLKFFWPVPAEVCRDRWLFWVEVAGIVPFAAYWLIKTYECAAHDTDQRIPSRREPRSAMPPASRAPAVPKAAASAAPARPASAPPAKAEAPSAWGEYKSLWREGSTGTLRD
jgi:hypothetical protein